MNYKNEIAVNIYDLQEALVLQYGEDFADLELRNIMFGDFYSNDCYKKFYFDEDILYSPEEYDDGSILCSIITFLKDIFPDRKYILVDITW
jgi:hypothetical protein